MIPAASKASQVVVRLVEGLPAKEAIGILASSIRDTGIERRIQAFYLYDMKKRGSFQELGFSKIEHMTRVKLEMSPSLTRELVLCGRALEELQLIDRAFEEGRISWTKVRHLLRIAVPETEAAWLERALELSARELQLEIKGSEQGRPPRKDKLGLPTVKFKSEMEFDAVEHEVWELAMKKVRQETGETLDEKSVLLALAEERLRKETRRGEPDSRRLDDSLFRVVIDQCSSCRESSVRTDEGSIALDQATAETLACDAPPPVVVGSEGSPARKDQQGLPPRRRRETLVRDGHRCRFCGHSEDVHVHHIVFRSEGGDHRSRNLVTLCKLCRVRHKEHYADSLIMPRRSVRVA
jgi:hypothetical protein